MCHKIIFPAFIFLFGLATPFATYAQDIYRDSVGIIEMRNYIIKPGLRDSFIRYFENNLVKPQEDLHGYPFARYKVKGAPDNFFWIRSFYDMKTRSAFLPAFYYGAEWKRNKKVANNLLVNNDNVHLLQPLQWTRDSLYPVKAVSRFLLIPKGGIVVIDFYISNTKLVTLLQVFSKSYLPLLKELGIHDFTLWTSVLQPNDFPQLPVFQDPNLLVGISFYKDEPAYRMAMKRVKLKMPQSLQTELEDAITLQNTIILYPTKASIRQ